MRRGLLPGRGYAEEPVELPQVRVETCAGNACFFCDLGDWSVVQIQIPQNHKQPVLRGALVDLATFSCASCNPAEDTAQFHCSIELLLADPVRFGGFSKGL